MSHNSPWVILLAPLLAAIVTALPKAWLGRKAYGIGALLQLAAFSAAVAVLYQVAGHGKPPVRLDLLLGLGRIPVILSMDRLAAVMMVVITGVGTLIYHYSGRYMQSEAGRARFHTLLSFTVVVLVCMVSSANLLMLFLFWQLLSWLLGLLPYNYGHAPTVKGAFRTVTILRIGDLCFLAGICLAYRYYGTLDFELLFSRAKATDIVLSLWRGGGPSIRAVTAIALLIFVGGMSKSAQFPLHQWLPDFLYAPTPVCAFLHAGIINAGGFLLNRLAPLYGLSPSALHVVFAVGLLTAFLGASMMLTQNDIKKTLGYSTVGQMGYMIMECGLGAFSLAIFHLIAHGLFKATIFLNCGHVIHAARQEPRLPAKDEEEEPAEFSLLAWLTGFATSLVLPLTILLAIHGVLSIPLKDSQGTVIFLFFSWFTSSQAILTLYRLKAVASGKVAALMLLTLLLVVSTYLLAAEVFSDFLYPQPGDVAYYFRAAGLPDWLFDFMIVVTSLFVIAGWILIYARSHGRSIRAPGRVAKWIGVLQVQLYLFFMNRLYIDAAWLRAGQAIMHLARRLDRSPRFPQVVGLLGLVVAVGLAAWTGGGLSLRGAGLTALAVLAALMLPLFPFHGVYVMALTRLRGPYPLLLGLLMPIAGYCGLHYLLPMLPRGLLGGIRLLALLGALYGSFKALMQVKAGHLLAYAGLALLSLLWWHLAIAGTPTPQAAIYTASVALVTAGLRHALQRVKLRYGPLDEDLRLDQIGGLVHSMPRFSVLLALLVMAAAGLPPFGLFSGFTMMLLHSSAALSLALVADLVVILSVWFAAAWYLCKLMQRFLFGPRRPDILHEDLMPGEVASLVIMVVVLVALGAAPLGFRSSNGMASTPYVAMERGTWRR
ncbi:MAG TPA: proton-conducting transporter membrane subunit [Pseudomonadota bacterium]|nr:proton-conducting transporter membrane subunit [Pseudomonadota bacterium]